MKTVDAMINKVVKRASALKLTNRNYDTLCLRMDLESAVQNQTMNLDTLLGFKDGDFVHDIVGIANNMDRSSWPGKLTGCFLPRCYGQ